MADGLQGYIDPQLLGQTAQAGSAPESSQTNGRSDAIEGDEDDNVTASKRDELRETDADEEGQRPPKKKKQRSPDVEEYNEGREESEQDRRRREMLRKIDAAAKGPKKRPRKKADETDLDQVADDEVVRMRDMMQAAASEDQDANIEKRPATAKLRLLKEAVETLQK
jgi:transcription factor SPN1